MAHPTVRMAAVLVTHVLFLSGCGSATGIDTGVARDAAVADAQGPTDVAHDQPAVNADADPGVCVSPPPDNGFAGAACCPSMNPLGQCWSGAYCNVRGTCCWRRDSGRHCMADADCCSGHCDVAGLCTACTDQGGACDAVIPCCSGVCAAGRCG